MPIDSEYDVLRVARAEDVWPILVKAVDDLRRRGKATQARSKILEYIAGRCGDDDADLLALVHRSTRNAPLGLALIETWSDMFGEPFACVTMAWIAQETGQGTVRLRVLLAAFDRWAAARGLQKIRWQTARHPQAAARRYGRLGWTVASTVFEKRVNEAGL